MQSSTWRDVIARIPLKLHNKLAVVTSVGIEIALQEVIQMQDEYLVVRGRLSGTSDAGRLFFVPFDQITYVGILKLMLENEIAEICGTGGPKTAASPAPAPAQAAEAVTEPAPEAAEPEPELEPEPEPVEAELPPRTEATPVKFPNRAELLERIKSRSQQGLRPLK